MCYKGKCFYCIPVENGCLVLAILSAIATCLTLLASVIMGILTIAGAIFVTRSVQRQNYGFYGPDEDVELAVNTAAGLAAGVILAIDAVVAVASLIAFIFSVLLCNGICKRRPGQVKAYFIYGVVITVLTVMASVLQLAIDDQPEIGLGGLAGCVIYSLFLLLVHHTHVKLRDGAIFKDHIRLVES